MNEERLSGLGKLLIHGGTDYGIPEPEVTKVAEVNEPGFILTEFPE